MLRRAALLANHDASDDARQARDIGIDAPCKEEIEVTPASRAYRRRPGTKHARQQRIASLTSLDDVERAHVQRVLAESATLGEAAELLGINPATLWRKRRRWGLS